MDPEEAFVPPLPMPFANRPARIFIQELADHSLRNRMENSRIGPTIGCAVLRETVNSWWGICGPRLGPGRIIVIVG
jgi:hypothetical protein